MEEDTIRTIAHTDTHTHKNIHTYTYTYTYTNTQEHRDSGKKYEAAHRAQKVANKRCETNKSRCSPSANSSKSIAKMWTFWRQNVEKKRSRVLASDGIDRSPEETSAGLANTTSPHGDSGESHYSSSSRTRPPPWPFAQRQHQHRRLLQHVLHYSGWQEAEPDLLSASKTASTLAAVWPAGIKQQIQCRSGIHSQCVQ